MDLNVQVRLCALQTQASPTASPVMSASPQRIQIISTDSSVTTPQRIQVHNFSLDNTNIHMCPVLWVEMDKISGKCWKSVKMSFWVIEMTCFCIFPSWLFFFFKYARLEEVSGFLVIEP